MLPTLTQKLGIRLTLCASPSTRAFQCFSCPANCNGDNTSGGTAHEACSDLHSSKFRGHCQIVQAELGRYRRGGIGVHGVSVRKIDADTVVEEADLNDDEEPNGAAATGGEGPNRVCFPVRSTSGGRNV
ncbi:hypothetical protein EDD17DRAFT_1621234, partial [Pisolithus thermaeus]